VCLNSFGATFSLLHKNNYLTCRFVTQSHFNFVRLMLVRKLNQIKIIISDIPISINMCSQFTVKRMHSKQILEFITLFEWIDPNLCHCLWRYPLVCQCLYSSVERTLEWFHSHKPNLTFDFTKKCNRIYIGTYLCVNTRVLPAKLNLFINMVK